MAGGGAVAARKFAPLLAAGAEIVVIAPTVDPAIEQALSEGTLSIERRTFEVSDLDGAFLAIVATDRPDVNRAVVEAAKARGVLVNATDDPDGCDFTVPATVRRGDVTVAAQRADAAPRSRAPFGKTWSAG